MPPVGHGDSLPMALIHVNDAQSTGNRHFPTFNPVSVMALFSAPHRSLFLCGALAAIATMAWWWMVHFSAAPPALSVVPSQAHGWLMLYGIFPFFMSGFILTAGPKWLAVPPPRPPRWLAVVALMAAGLLTVLAGTRLSAPVVLAGMALYTLGFAGLTLIWFDRIRASRAPDRLHAWMVLCAFVLGVIGLLCGLAWIAAGDARLWLATRSLALWGFLLPVFLTVCHRMVPFFTGNVLQPYTVWRPRWLLFAMLAGSALHGLTELTGVTSFPVDVAAALLQWYVCWRWQVWRTFRVPLLGMLHAAFLWCAIAFSLYALQSGLALAGIWVGGYAPLHAMTAGFFATMLLGFATRVTLGHSGRPLQVGRVLILVYLGMHLVALSRVLSDFLPAARGPLQMAAAIGWLLVLAVWAWKVVPIYLKRRADGQPG